MAPALKVGELASRTGLSVRTLHHYDEIGLLAPSRRTAAGHRVYGMEEVRRLQQIASLRQLGLSLQDIRVCLDDPEYSLERVLALQVRRLKDEIGRQTRLVDLLETLRRRVSEGETLSVDDVTASIEATVQYEKYYTPEQLEKLSRRAHTVGPEGMAQAQEDWRTLFRDLARCREAGAAPDAPEVLALARKARSLVEAFTGGDPGIRASLERMYKDGAGARAMQSQGMGVDGQLMAYYQEAMAALNASEGDQA